MERRTGSFPAGDVFSDALYRCSSSSISAQMAFEDYSEYEHSYRMGMLLEGPQDEHDLAELWRSPLYPPTNTKEIEYGSYSPISYDGMAIQACDHVPPETEMVSHRRTMPPATPPEEEAPTTMVLSREGVGSTRMMLSHRRRRPTLTTAPVDEGGRTSSIVDVLDHIPNRGSRARAPRKIGTWKGGTEFLDHFLGLCSACKGGKREDRKHNKHWTPKDVELLVKGVTEFGVGHWTDLKDRWFSDSNSGLVRTEDKWRNLVQGYVLRPTSKKKGRNAHLDEKLIKKIQKLAAKHPYPK